MKLFGSSKNGKHRASGRSGSVEKRTVNKAAATGSGKRERVGKSKNKKFAIIGSSVAGALLVGVMVIGGIAASGDTVYPNVLFNGVEIGGMTFNEVYDALEAADYNSENNTVTVELCGGDKVIKTLQVTSEDASLSMSIEEAATMAVKYGHDGLFGSAFKYIGCLMGHKDIGDSEELIDEQAVKDMISQVAGEVDSEYVDNKYEILEKELSVTKGSGERKVDQNELYTIICDAFANGNFQPIKYNVSKREPEAINFQSISEQIFVEAQNARYDSSTASVVDGVPGVSLDVNAAKAAYDKAEIGKAFKIPFTITQPEITAGQMKEMLFSDVLASKSTSLTSNSNRNTNIKLASQAINGTVLNPGDVFSFNGTVGQRTSAKGYKEAGAYVGNQTVNEVGGGICQVSSTIYYCTLVANLEIVDRDNHRYPVSYLPLGMDATVNWGSLDFKFANNTDYPIKINAYVDGGTLYVKLLGTKTNDHTFKPTYKTVETIGFNTIEKESADVTSETVETSGVTGYKIDTYLSEYDGNGNLIKTTYVGRSYYKSRDKVVLIPVQSGTGGEGSSGITGGEGGSGTTGGEGGSGTTGGEGGGTTGGEGGGTTGGEGGGTTGGESGGGTTGGEGGSGTTGGEGGSGTTEAPVTE